MTSRKQRQRPTSESEGRTIGMAAEVASRTQLDGLVLGFAGSAICLAEQDLHVSIAGLVSAATN